MRTRDGVFCQPCLNKLWKAKGYAAERDFVHRLRKLGFFAVRMAVSGAGTDPIPDVVAFHKNPPTALAFEVKAVHKWRCTVYAWKEKRGKKEPSQIIKCLGWVRGIPDVMVKRAGVAVKFLLGERQKSPWVVKFVDDPGDDEKVQNVTVDISDTSDMPELTEPTRSIRARRISKRRRRKR